jgi:hypothetical protein
LLALCLLSKSLSILYACGRYFGEDFQGAFLDSLAAEKLSCLWIPAVHDQIRELSSYTFLISRAFLFLYRGICGSGSNDLLADKLIRKGSTASLSHIEGALTHSNRTAGNVRSNMSSSSLAQLEGIEQMTLMPGGESVTSPTTSSASRTGKFFVFGGARGTRKTANKQRQQVLRLDRTSTSSQSYYHAAIC